MEVPAPVEIRSIWESVYIIEDGLADVLEKIRTADG